MRETKQNELLSMEIIKTWNGKKYAVVSIVVKYELHGSEWKEVSREPKKIITIPMFDHTPEGHKRCKKVLRKLRQKQNEEEEIKKGLEATEGGF